MKQFLIFVLGICITDPAYKPCLTCFILLTSPGVGFPPPRGAWRRARTHRHPAPGARARHRSLARRGVAYLRPSVRLPGPEATAPSTAQPPHDRRMVGAWSDHSLCLRGDRFSFHVIHPLCAAPLLASPQSTSSSRGARHRDRHRRSTPHSLRCLEARGAVPAFIVIRLPALRARRRSLSGAAAFLPPASHSTSRARSYRAARPAPGAHQA